MILGIMILGAAHAIVLLINKVANFFVIFLPYSTLLGAKNAF